MAAPAELSRSRLRLCLDYCPHSGTFTWINRQSQVAGCRSYDGFVRIYVAGSVYLAHRLAFLYMTGAFPAHLVIHLDGDRSNNRWDNLREATRQDLAASRQIPVW